MKLEDQICTLEQSKRLVELGVYQPETYWKWPKHRNVTEPLGKHNYNSLLDWVADYPAFTVAELGEMINKRFSWYGHVLPQLYDGFFGIALPESESISSIAEPTEAKARAAMLIHLLENATPSPSKTPEA